MGGSRPGMQYPFHITTAVFRPHILEQSIGISFCLGGIIAAAWASLVYLGEDGFMKTAKEVQEAWTKLCDGIRSIPELYIVGDPVSCIVAFASKSLNILQVADVMEKMGYILPS